MTDRELLELAAKAAGFRVGFEPDGKERCRYDLYWSNVHHQLAWHGKSAGSEYPRPIFWNPLTDSGQALELAIKLRLVLLLELPRIGIGPRMDGPEVYVEEDEDEYAATRRAIVQAAAEIGRQA